MELQDIAHISGKSGLHRILKPTRSGVIVESLDEKKTKQVVGTQNRVSVLKEISIYTTDKDGSVLLENVLEKIFSKYNTSIPVTPDSTTAEQGKFLESILPNYDKARVYNSDIKRLITWYGLLVKNAPELFIKPVEEIKEEEIKQEKKKPASSKKTEEKIIEEKPIEEKPAVKKPKKEKPVEENKTETKVEIKEEKPKPVKKEKSRIKKQKTVKYFTVFLF